MTPYQVSSEIYGGFFYPGITLNEKRSCFSFIFDYDTTYSTYI